MRSCLLLLVAGCSSLPLSGTEVPVEQALLAADLPPEDRDPIRVRPGDRLRVTVEGHPEFSGALEADAAGRVRVPLLDAAVRVGGSTPEQAREALAAAVAPCLPTEPKVRLEVDRGEYYTILGDVPRPGRYPLHAGEEPALLPALARAFGEVPPDPWQLREGSARGGTVTCFNRTPVGVLYVRVPWESLLRGDAAERVRVRAGFVLHVEEAP
ncbi:MAG: polysaccharide biosynthesis/export family protein [Planctomycetales bacterium]|nr:polysaccharide biosynthesis/export family protein [Planctomycetales bacterium]